MVAFQVGSFYEPNSLERTNTSNYRDTIERALPSDLLAGNRHVGLAAITGGAAPGLVGNSNWSAKGGIFSTTCRGHAGRAGQEKGGIGAVEKLLLPVSLAGAAAAVACRSRIMKLVPPKVMSAMSSAER